MLGVMQNLIEIPTENPWLRVKLIRLTYVNEFNPQVYSFSSKVGSVYSSVDEGGSIGKSDFTSESLPRLLH